MNDRLAWPALRGLRQPPPVTLAYGRGVWGKVHEARSDYRWIAASADFPYSGGLEREFTVGREAVGRGLFWRPVPGRRAGFAGSLYPSRARDLAGRENFLEKQVLAWAMAEELPAALGALLLLRVVADWRDDIWWERDSGRLRADHEYVLPISDPAEIRCTEDAIATAAGRGLEALMDIDDAALEAFYAGLLARGRAALPGTALPPEALAALLLPLDRSLSEGLSLVQWAPRDPAAGTDAELLAGRWNIVVLPEGPRTASGIAAAGVGKAVRNMVTALRERNPAVLAPARTAPPERAASPPPQPGNARLLTKGEPIPPRALLVLEEPPADTREVMGDIHTFACDVDRRWLDVTEYRDRLSEIPKGSEEAALLSRWAKEVRNNRPHYADPRHWAAKVEVLEKLAACIGSEGR